MIEDMPRKPFCIGIDMQGNQCEVAAEAFTTYCISS